MRKSTKRKIAGFYGCSVLLGATLTLLVDFFRAYFIYDVTTLIITFNDYGEAIPEMFIFTTGIICFLYYWATEVTFNEQ